MDEAARAAGSAPGVAASSPATDAWLVAQLFAIAPSLLGGVLLRAPAGPVRDRWLSDLRSLFPAAMPWRAVPLHVDADRLLGGIDLAATLQVGRPVALRGLLAEADGGVLLLAMAERIAGATTAHVAAALDTGSIACARHGLEATLPARFGVVAIDEGDADDDRPAPALLDRLAFEVDLRGVGWRELATLPPLPTAAEIAAAAARLEAIADEADIVEALCGAAFALGVESARPCLQAVRVARVAAARTGAPAVTAVDAALAARLVLAARATRLPASEEAGEAEQEPAMTPEPEAVMQEPAATPEDDAAAQEPAPMPNDAAAQEPAPDAKDPDEHARSEPAPDADPAEPPSSTPLDDVVLAAATAALPAALLARLLAGPTSVRGASSGRAGFMQANARRGRPAGLRRERPRGGARLDLVATLRAAAPWQRVRGRLLLAASEPVTPIRIRSEDFHVARFRQRGRTTTIFVVDASGSAALHRLAEAKGAVELLLADCYVRRDSVAVIGFRGRVAELLLPPTRSLARAKRSLAELAGGGGTPLASGLDAACELAASIRRRGDSPAIVVLSDGRANVARDGSPGRARAEGDALAAASALHASGAVSLFIDTSTQPHPLARALAEAMSARYVPLPHAEAATLSAAVRGAATARQRGR